MRTATTAAGLGRLRNVPGYRDALFGFRLARSLTH